VGLWFSWLNRLEIAIFSVGADIIRPQSLMGGDLGGILTPRADSIRPYAKNCGGLWESDTDRLKFMDSSTAPKFFYFRRGGYYPPVGQ